MSAIPLPGSRAPVAPQVRAAILLCQARDAAAELAEQSMQEHDRIKAELLARIEAREWGAAMLLLARLSTYTSARSA